MRVSLKYIGQLFLAFRRFLVWSSIHWSECLEVYMSFFQAFVGKVRSRRSRSETEASRFTMA
jgi:hypothetical protein